MPKTIDEMTEGFSPERKKRIEKAGERALDEYKSLKKIREELGVTQVQLAKDLDVTQNNISTLESRGDIKISTLKNYLNALGGELVLAAKFPGQDTKIIESLSEETRT